ncbi:MAG: mechanosensitive ion channel family protein, partial [Alistipes sp.]|nr:mechanosensitive ion channel family protein [Alistipes sp.]
MQKIISRWVDSLLVGLGFTETQADGVDQWIILGIICVIAMAVDLVCRTVLLKVVNRLVLLSKAHWD